jgi:PII-like signaling protein
MKGTYLRFYTHENRKHKGILLYEWLLEQAKHQGIHGGTAFRAIAGFGRHGILHEQHFFELAGDLTVVVDFVVSDEESQRLFDLIDAERIRLVYVQAPVIFGMRNANVSDI